MQALESLPLWGLQDAIKAAFTAALSPIGVTFSLGIPTNMQPTHVWVSSEVDGSNEFEETDDTPSATSTTLKLIALCTYAADEYEGTRAEMLRVLTACTTALQTLLADGSADQLRISEYKLDEGRDGDGHRQLAFTLTFAAVSW